MRNPSFTRRVEMLADAKLLDLPRSHRFNKAPRLNLLPKTPSPC